MHTKLGWRRPVGRPAQLMSGRAVGLWPAIAASAVVLSLAQREHQLHGRVDGEHEPVVEPAELPLNYVSVR